MFKRIFGSNKEDKLTNLLIEFLERGGVAAYAKEQAEIIVREQERVRFNNERRNIILKKEFYEYQMEKGEELSEADKREYDYVKFLVEEHKLDK